MHTLIGKRVVLLRPGEIRSSAVAARKRFDRYELQRLADSISANGIIEPLIVRKYAGRYELIAGERRLRAAKMVGLRRIPCVIHRADLPLCAVYSVLENLQRQPLDPFEEAEALRTLSRQFHLSQTETASRLGLAGSELNDRFLLLELSPDFREQLSTAGLSREQIFRLLRLPTEERQTVLARITDYSSPPESAMMVETAEEQPKPAEEPIRKSAIGDLRIFANSLYRLVDLTQEAGVNIGVRKTENDKYVEYRVKIHKESFQNGCHQLKIC